EKAVLLWIWNGLLLVLGVLLLVLWALGRSVPSGPARPPLGDWVADHPAPAALLWGVAALALWAGSIRDAWTSAGRINRGEVSIRYPLRRQLVHVLASQLLGFIPFAGLFFPPGVVAEALDALHRRRGPDRRRLFREGGQALVEWALTRAALYAVGLMIAGWLVWWLFRAANPGP
ncbi:MAG TPA: hypothetical protein VFU47_14140, partial [Armatimonadota bacterium]|nr:hypothetical protein [Armatimonadota bacterium]